MAVRGFRISVTTEKGLALPKVTEKLKNPSVIEAICELRFAGGISYTILPGAMRERLKGKFPNFEVLPAAFMSAFSLPASVAFHRFKSSDSPFIVQTGPGLLTINVLPGYPSFAAFRDVILYALGQFREIYDPGTPTRVGLRYINHLQRRTEKRELKDYLRMVMQYPIELEKQPQEISARFTFPYGSVGTLALAIGFPASTDRGAFGALLDLDLYRDNPQFELNRFPEWLDEAHDVIHGAFVSSVSTEVMTEMRG